METAERPDTCPQCRSTDVRVTLRTVAGGYCSCEQCAHLWHFDNPPAQPSVTPQRRQTDHVAQRA